MVRIEDEVTVKRWHRKSSSQISLIAENPDYAPIEVDLSEQEVSIEGISVGSSDAKAMQRSGVVGSVESEVSISTPDISAILARPVCLPES